MTGAGMGQGERLALLGLQARFAPHLPLSSSVAPAQTELASVGSTRPFAFCCQDRDASSFQPREPERTHVPCASTTGRWGGDTATLRCMPGSGSAVTLNVGFSGWLHRGLASAGIPGAAMGSVWHSASSLSLFDSSGGHSGFSLPTGHPPRRMECQGLPAPEPLPSSPTSLPAGTAVAPRDLAKIR